MRVYLHLLSIAFLGLLLACPPARANPRLSEPDKEAHVIVAFQATFLIERLSQDLKNSPGASLALGNGVVLAGSFLKESFVDNSFSWPDVARSMVGAGFASILFLALPAKSYELEAEGGLTHLSPHGIPPPGATRPPASNLVHAQTTIWFGNIAGFHQFSGGADDGSSDDSGKRLFGGAGLRLSLLSLGEPKKGPPVFRLWSGVDYGFLLFSVSSRAVPFKNSAHTLFYSSGLRWGFGGSFGLSAEGLYVPYPGARVWGVGASLGFFL